MSSGECYKCNNLVLAKEPKKNGEIFGFPCDHCRRFVCQNCNELTSTEIRAVLLSKRTLPFYCKDCLLSVKQLLGLIDRVSLLEQSVQLIKAELERLPLLMDDVKELKTRVSDLSSGGASQASLVPGNLRGALQPGLGDNEVWNEIQDRYSRSKNVMLYNVPENGNDVQSIASVLSALTNTPPLVSHSARVGKANAKGARPLKITLNSPEEVQELFRKRQKLKGRDIYINFDLTPKQRDFERAVWSDYKTRKSKGENIQIKYKGGVPHIVGISENSK